MKARNIAFLFAALVSFSAIAHADNAQDFKKLNQSLDTSVQQTKSEKDAVKKEASNAPNMDDPNLIAPIRKQNREPAQSAAAAFGD